MVGLVYRLVVAALLLVRFACQLAAALLTLFVVLAVLVFVVASLFNGHLVPADALATPLAILLSAIAADFFCALLLTAADWIFRPSPPVDLDEIDRQNVRTMLTHRAGRRMP